MRFFILYHLERTKVFLHCLKPFCSPSTVLYLSVIWHQNTSLSYEVLLHRHNLVEELFNTIIGGVVTTTDHRHHSFPVTEWLSTT